MSNSIITRSGLQKLPNLLAPLRELRLNVYMPYGQKRQTHDKLIAMKPKLQLVVPTPNKPQKYQMFV